MMNKKVLNILFEAAKLYKENLLNKNIMFIHYNVKTKIYSYTEMLFEDIHFLHLTGIEFSYSTFHNKKASLFFKKCLHKRLKLSEIDYRQDGTTVLKLKIIRDLMNIHKNTNMIGTYNNLKPKLIIDKVCGGIYASMGIYKNKYNYYIPKSALREDIRKLVTKYDIVKCILVKNKNDKTYTVITKNKLDIPLNQLPKEIISKIDSSLIEKSL